MNAQRGDLLFWKGDPGDLVNQVIMCGSGSQYVHVARYLGPYKKVIEATLEFGNIEREYPYQATPEVWYYPDATPHQNEMMIWREKGRLGRKYELTSFLSKWLKHIPFLRCFLGASKPLFDSTYLDVCSDLVSVSYESIMGVNLCEGINPMSHTPGDLISGGKLLRRS
jgi:hypothetical protein